MDASLFDAVAMSSVNLPREFNLTSCGTLVLGMHADINMLDRNQA